MPRTTTSSVKVTIWEMLRDIFVLGINKGQLLPLLVGLILVIATIRLPPGDLSILAHEVLNGLKQYSLIGYFIGGISTIGWYLHVKRMRRIQAHELTRIAAEKSELQKRLLGNKVQSSRNKSK